MTLVSNPHDKLFKQIWSDRETAADFLANYLPGDISGLMDLNIPLVLYHGRQEWNGSTSLLHLIASTDKRLVAYIPDFSFILFDLSKYSDDQIKGAVLSRVGVLLFKHVFTPGYEEKLPEILGLLKALLEKQTGLQYIEIIIRYILRTAENSVSPSPFGGGSGWG